MPGAVPLEEMQVLLPDCDTTQPALHPSRVEKMVFVRYLAPPESLDDRAEYDAWMERVAYLCDDLRWLLQLPHDKFWCQIVFDDSLHKALDRFLHHCPRSLHPLVNFPEAAQQRHQDLCRLVFMTYLRMSTHKESKDHFITPKVFGDILYENFLFDVPKMLDLCSLYGAANTQILNKMLTNIFSQQPKYLDDLRETLPTIAQVLSEIASRCGVSMDVPGLSPQKLDGGRAPGLTSLPTSDLQDIVLYLHDTALTLHRFLEAYPPASLIFHKFNFCSIIANFYESVHPELMAVLKQHKFQSQKQKKQLMVKLHHTKKFLMQVFHAIVSKACLQPILEQTSNGDLVRSCTEDFLHTMSSVLGERRFLAAYEGLFSFQDDADLLLQSTNEIDGTQFEYIQSAINSAFATFGHRKCPRGDTNTGGRTSPDGAPDSLGGASAITAPAPRVPPSEGATQTAAVDGTPADWGEGAGSTPRPSDIKVLSLVSCVKDLFPDLGDGFIELGLAELDWSTERLISSLLEDALPLALQDVQRDLPRLEREPDQGDGQVDSEDILDSRKNVFDNDEFDIFRNKVDMSKVHVGKKDMEVDLEDKSVVRAVKATYDAYGSMDKESMYDTAQMYEDEYDDTYDTTNVGADDADSADELTNTKVLPRILQELERKKARSEGRLPTSGDSDDDEEEGGGGKSQRDDFVSDPAKLREQAERKRQSQAAHRGKKGRGGGGGGGGGHHRDVVGAPKGQGQSGDVQHNRRLKEKHKGQRHRNLADKKMSKGMF